MKAVITRTKGPPVSVTINVPTPAGIGPFAEKTLVAGDQCVKADPSARPAAVGLLDSGVMAGIGAAINTGAVIRGTSVAVIGCGGVGVAAIAGSALAGAYGPTLDLEQHGGRTVDDSPSASCSASSP